MTVVPTSFFVPDLDPDWEYTALADWVELVALTAGICKKGVLRSDLSRLIGPNQDAGLLTEQAWSEVERRLPMYADSSPLQLSGDVVECRRRSRNGLLHFFLAFLSIGENVTNDARALFEYCVTDLVRGLTGQQGLRMGAPRGPEWPRSLAESVALYAKRAQERVGILPLLPSDKDYGLDVASWKPFADKRGAYLPFIGQCATGKAWYEEHKARDLSVSEWDPYFNWAVRPVRFFALPFVIPPSQWERTAHSGGLPLDRPRLLELGMTSPITKPRRVAIARVCVLAGQ